MSGAARTDGLVPGRDGEKPYRSVRTLLRGMCAAGCACWFVAGCVCRPSVKPIFDPEERYEQIDVPKVSGAMAGASCCW